jgi:hypothetical protein
LGYYGEPLWLSGKVVKNEKINEIERTQVRSPPRATSLNKKRLGYYISYICARPGLLDKNLIYIRLVKRGKLFQECFFLWRKTSHNQTPDALFLVSFGLVTSTNAFSIRIEMSTVRTKRSGKNRHRQMYISSIRIEMSTVHTKRSGKNRHRQMYISSIRIEMSTVQTKRSEKNRLTSRQR